MFQIPNGIPYRIGRFKRNLFHLTLQELYQHNAAVDVLTVYNQGTKTSFGWLYIEFHSFRILYLVQQF